MAPVNRTNIRRPRRTIARRRLAPLTRSIAALSLKQKPVLFRPRANKVTSRRNFVGLRNPRGSVNINSVSTLNGTERIATITIPTSSQPGELLYTLENNPNSAPRARAVASQFDSWHSVTELEVETTGNAFAKNFIIIRHVPNGDPGRLPSDATSLLISLKRTAVLVNLSSSSLIQTPKGSSVPPGMVFHTTPGNQSMIPILQNETTASSSSFPMAPQAPNPLTSLSATATRSDSTDPSSFPSCRTSLPFSAMDLALHQPHPSH